MAYTSWKSVPLGALALPLLYCLISTFSPLPLLPQHITAGLSTSLTQPPPTPFQCVEPKYTLRMVSYDPFIAHIENFFSDDESAELIRLGQANAKQSRIVTPDREMVVDTRFRDSRTTFLVPQNPVVDCVAHRAATIQGHLDRAGIRIQATLYGAGGYFDPHMDTGTHFVEDPLTGKNAAGLLHRVTTIFGVLDADCENCGTTFPELGINAAAIDPRMCEFIECDQEDLTFKAVKNNAVFWRNRFNNGTVDDRLLHAGRPLERGFKYGLNIWTDVL